MVRLQVLTKLVHMDSDRSVEVNQDGRGVVAAAASNRGVGNNIVAVNGGGSHGRDGTESEGGEDSDGLEGEHFRKESVGVER